MTRNEIREHNRKVEYNTTTGSWIMDIIACMIFFPYLFLVLYRRGRYCRKIDLSQSIERFNI